MVAPFSAGSGAFTFFTPPRPWLAPSGPPPPSFWIPRHVFPLSYINVQWHPPARRRVSVLLLVVFLVFALSYVCRFCFVFHHLRVFLLMVCLFASSAFWRLGTLALVTMKGRESCSCPRRQEASTKRPQTRSCARRKACSMACALRP